MALWHDLLDPAIRIEESEASKAELDSRSVHIANVDYSSTPEEVQAHFNSCGAINRVTIVCDKHTGHPKGFAYCEFASVEGVKRSLSLTDSVFKGRVLTVVQKRTNLPSFMLRGRGRGGARGGGRGFRGGRGGGFRGGRGGGFRGGRGARGGMGAAEGGAEMQGVQQQTNAYKPY